MSHMRNHYTRVSPCVMQPRERQVVREAFRNTVVEDVFERVRGDAREEVLESNQDTALRCTRFSALGSISATSTPDVNSNDEAFYVPPRIRSELISSHSQKSIGRSWQLHASPPSR